MAAAFDFDNHDNNDELWRECAAWLTRMEMLRADHRANRPQAGIADLANILRDGVLICQLLNKIDPGCIDMKDVSLKPTMAQFLCIRNIQVFLKACVISFGLKESDLFEPLMLFDLSNFHRVLCTLSKLSLSTKAQRIDIEGFHAQKVTTENEVIYQSLKSVDVRNNVPNYFDPSWVHFKIPGPRPGDQEVDAYDDLCYVTFSSSLPELYNIWMGEITFWKLGSVMHRSMVATPLSC